MLRMLILGVLVIQSTTGITDWADICYNFLVGQDGNAYEGRGWDVREAHAGNWNGVSLGIAVIGNFMDSRPNVDALNTVKQLIDCGVKQKKISGSYTLHGHRDGCATSCPGDAFTTSSRPGLTMEESSPAVAIEVFNACIADPMAATFRIVLSDDVQR